LVTKQSFASSSRPRRRAPEVAEGRLSADYPGKSAVSSPRSMLCVRLHFLFWRWFRPCSYSFEILRAAFKYLEFIF
jgi:hypothetical protein